MRDRLELSKKLHTICDHIYFQPGSNTTMAYPCIRYEFNGPFDMKADNGNFVTYGRYLIINIYKNPTSKLFDALRETFKYITWDRQYIADGLYHDVYTLYF